MTLKKEFQRNLKGGRWQIAKNSPDFPLGEWNNTEAKGTSSGLGARIKERTKQKGTKLGVRTA